MAVPYLFFFLVGLGFDLHFMLAEQVLAKQAFYHLSHTSSPFCSHYFEDGVMQTVCLGWPQTAVLWISAPKLLGLQS
jgi:hypothetical protein